MSSTALSVVGSKKQKMASERPTGNWWHGEISSATTSSEALAKEVVDLFANMMSKATHGGTNSPLEAWADHHIYELVTTTFTKL